MQDSNCFLSWSFANVCVSQTRAVPCSAGVCSPCMGSNVIDTAPGVSELDFGPSDLQDTARLNGFVFCAKRTLQAHESKRSARWHPLVLDARPPSTPPRKEDGDRTSRQGRGRSDQPTHVTHKQAPHLSKQHGPSICSKHSVGVGEWRISCIRLQNISTQTAVLLKLRHGCGVKALRASSVHHPSCKPRRTIAAPVWD
jgi:hypothetical protein